MKSEKDKRIFTLSLIILFLITTSVYLFRDSQFVNDSNINAESVSSNSLMSTEYNGFGIKNLNDEAFFIDGKGQLDSDTLVKIIHQNGQNTTDIIHLILGDNITDLGYHSIANLPYLESVKLGAGIKTIRNGAFMNCKKLEWVFVPSGIEKVGRDFLYNCPIATIVTDGKANFLENPEDYYRVIEDVRNYDDLSRGIAKTTYATFLPKNLYSTGGNSSDTKIVLLPGELQYGPYTPIKQGVYYVEYQGNNLESLRETDIYINPNSDYTISPNNVLIDKNLISYEIEVPSELYQLELGVRNSNNYENVEITSITVYERNTNIVLPNYIRGWWDESFFLTSTKQITKKDYRESGWNGKNICFYGDSLFGQNTELATNVESNNLPDLVGQRLGMKVYNRSFCGSAVSRKDRYNISWVQDDAVADNKEVIVYQHQPNNKSEFVPEGITAIPNGFYEDARISTIPLDTNLVVIMGGGK